MKKSYIFLAIAAAILILILVSFLDLGPNTGSETKSLKKVKVKDYKGKDLSSVYDFRENSIKGVQYINISDYNLEVSGLVENPRNYTYDEVISKQNYEKVVTLNCVEGWSATILWKGILVRDLLDEVQPDESVREVIFYAYDSYSTAFPIDYFYDKDIIMAYEMNNETMIPARGFPFQLVAEDRWGYKWIKWITKIELSREEGYEGFWEQRGYAREGNLNESFLD